MNEQNCSFTYNGITYRCAIALALGIIGGKWKPLIIWHLKDGTMRFNELRHSIGNVTSKILTEQLRELESDGLIGRTVYPEVPPKVEYFLTKKGLSVIPVLETLSKWGANFCPPD